MDIVNRVASAQNFADLAQAFVADGLADQRALDFARPQRRRAHAAERNRRARYLAAAVLFDQRRRRDNREIAVPARKFDEAMAVPRRPAWKT